MWYIEYLAKRAFPLTIDIIKKYAWAVDKKSGKNLFGKNGPSRKWWQGFKSRAKKRFDFRLRRPDMLDRSRVSDTIVEDLREYFKQLKEVMDKFDFHSKPSRIYNCDESMLDLNKKAQKVIVPARSRHTYYRQSASREHVTIHCAVNAGGHALPPFGIFSKSFPGGNYARNGPHGAVYAKSDSGFMDCELMLKWFERLVIKNSPSDRTPDNPVILLLDGHVSHHSEELIAAAQRENVILMALVPHTMHVCQPSQKFEI
uniref:uncharacterized protein LOC120337202 n=1 Tax=Styela clava TaxID=7725 RepID=UPI00193AC12D|nr:uncharacterized protein LOC120337202 [Styela clava]